MTIAFTELSKPAQRVAIAQDVIKNVIAGHLMPTRGFWLVDAEEELVRLSEDRDNRQVQEVLKTKKCEVCAIGALFASTVETYNCLTFDELQNKCEDADNDYDDYNTGAGLSLAQIMPYLTDFFSEDQLILIELAYEGGYGGFDEDQYIEAVSSTEGDCSDILERAYTIFSNESEDWRRLIAIMQNIIDNNGTFNP